MALIDVIKYEGGNNILVWKHPKEDFNTQAQLIVHHSQEAIVVMNGKASEPYPAGKHIVETENIPGLSGLITLATGGINPNHYEVYFINKTYSMDICWGTATPLLVQDPSLQIPFKLRAFGQFSARVENSQILLSKLVGTMNSFSQKKLVEYFRGIIVKEINSFIANLMKENSISVLEISSCLDIVSEKAFDKLLLKLTKYGLSLVEFSVESINIDEDEAFLRIRDSMVNRATQVIEGYTKKDEMGYDIAKTQAQNPGVGGQMSQVMTGLSAGAAIAPAVGNMVRNVMQPLGSENANTPQRDQFSIGVVNAKSSSTPDNSIELKCINCGSYIAENSKFCNQCGAPVTESNSKKLSCPICGTALPEKSAYCSSCGTKIE